MYYYLDKVEGDGRVALTRHNDNAKCNLNYNQYNFYAGQFNIHPNCIPEGTCLSFTEQNSFRVCFSDQIYLLQIYTRNQENILTCKTLGESIRDVSVESKNLILYEDFTQIQESDFDKLIGEFILVSGEYKYLMLSKNSFLLKTSISDLIWKKYESGTISSIKDGLVWVKTKDDKSVFEALPVFLLINNIKQSENYNSLIYSEVYIFQVNKVLHFKIQKKNNKAHINQTKKESNILKSNQKSMPKKVFNIQQFRNEFVSVSENQNQKSMPKKVFYFLQFKNEFVSVRENKIDYQNRNYNDRISLSDYPDIFNKPGFTYSEIYASQPIINKTLGSVIGHSLVEHFVRFKNDKFFQNFIESVFKEADVIHLFNDIRGAIASKCVNEFYQKIGAYYAFIKRIGEGILSLVGHDIETFEGLQELSDKIGCCIIFRNFTEGLQQVKIVPIDYKIRRKPIIHLGKYFSDYFLLYSLEMMTVDGYNGEAYKPRMNFPYYDENFKEERNLLKSAFRGLISRIDEIRDYLEKKLSGVKTHEISYTFDQAIKTYESYHSLKYNKIGGGKIKYLLKQINFQNVVSLITGKKYFCNCSCVKYFDEVSYPKITCTCKRDYSKEHLQNLSLDLVCYCQTMRVQDILSLL